MTGWMKTLLFVLLALSLSACGFQLRGKAALPFETLYVEGGNPALLAELQRAIGIGAATRIVATPGEAQAVLQLFNESREKRILSLSGVGRVNEFLLVQRVGFRLRDAKGGIMLPEQFIELRRDMSYDDTLVLAKESEEAMLFRDMQSDAVNQILRRLSGAKAAPPVEADN
jgi:LPS-assembly lipoprotein